MARRSKQDNRKRRRRRHWFDEETSENLPPYIPVDLDRLPQETAERARKWAERLAAPAPPPRRADIYRSFGPPALPKSKSKSKRKVRSGAEPTYDRDAIRAVAKEAGGHDKHRAWFYERVRDLCRVHQPRIKAPGSDRTMGRYVGDLYRGPKR